MPEYAWMYLNKQDSEYSAGPGYAKNSEHGRVLNVQASYSVLNMLEYAGFGIWGVRSHTHASAHR